MKKLLFCLLFFLLLAAPAYAENGIDVSSVEEGLPEDAREISGELVTDGSYDMRGAIARLADRAKRELAIALMRPMVPMLQRSSRPTPVFSKRRAM